MSYEGESAPRQASAWLYDGSLSGAVPAVGRTHEFGAPCIDVSLSEWESETESADAERVAVWRNHLTRLMRAPLH